MKRRSARQIVMQCIVEMHSTCSQDIGVEVLTT